tara:strand:- start:432 stop:665 length:234 start_codon:yes stop_codon:yes gene_type:complete
MSLLYAELVTGTSKIEYFGKNALDTKSCSFEGAAIITPLEKLNIIKAVAKVAWPHNLVSVLGGNHLMSNSLDDLQKK